MKVNITPLADNIVIKPEDSEQTTASGIIITETVKDKLHKGTVVAVGNGNDFEPITVKVGDTVLYAKYSSTPLELDGNDYVIIKEINILAIL